MGLPSLGLGTRMRLRRPNRRASVFLKGGRSELEDDLPPGSEIFEAANGGGAFARKDRRTAACSRPRIKVVTTTEEILKLK